MFAVHGRFGTRRFSDSARKEHVPIQLRVGGLPDLAHAALAEEGGDVVVAERGTDFERHRSVYRLRDQSMAKQ